MTANGPNPSSKGLKLLYQRLQGTHLFCVSGDLQGITVARMEVPCCTGITMLVMEARELAGTNTFVDEVIVGVRGDLLARRSLTDTYA